MFEEFVDAQEVECAAIGNPDDPSTVSTTRPGEILAGAEFYTYDDKYKKRRVPDRHPRASERGKAR